MHDTRRWSLPAVIGAIGIVYGDIGTSPLYALETALNATGGFNPLAVLGCLSLIFWSLMLSVTFKYVTVMMRADNQGEGGILALFALAQRAPEASRHWFRWLIGLARMTGPARTPGAKPPKSLKTSELAPIAGK